jgi:hypothetical protein
MSTPDPQLVKSAITAIYRAWLPLIGDTEAREQARAFASRFQIKGDTANARA